jgi:AsmA protein
MKTGSDSQPSPSIFARRWVQALAVVVAIFIVAIVLLPFLVNADSFRPKVEAELSSALGRQVTLGHIDLSVFSGSLVADNISVSDDPAFSSSPFFAARSLHIAVNVPALLLHRQLHIAGFTADSPSIQLIPDAHGNWNYSSLGRSSNTGSGSSTAPSDLSVDRFEIKNGSLTVAPLALKGKPVVYDHVDLVVEHLSLSNPMPFTLTADLPAGGSIKVSGTTGPLAQLNAASTPLQASFTARKLDPVAAGLIEPGSGIAMTADIDGQAASDGKTLTVNGKVKASHLKLAANGKPATKLVEIDLNVAEDLGKESGTIRDIALHTGSIAAHLAGKFQMAASGVTLDLHLSAPGLPVDALEELLPSAGVTLPSGSSLHGGTLTANLVITGPAESPRIAGPIEIDNTELAGFDLSSKIEGLLKPAGSSSNGGTAIRVVKADAVNTAQETQLSNIDIEVPSLGAATGAGTVSAAGALNFEMTAKLGSVSGVGLPIGITGTASSPSIHVHPGALLKQQATSLLGGVKNGSSGAKSGLSGLAKSLIHK